jgi:hypothetical protein
VALSKQSHTHLETSRQPQLCICYSAAAVLLLPSLLPRPRPLPPPRPSYPPPPRPSYPPPLPPRPPPRPPLPPPPRPPKGLLLSSLLLRGVRGDCGALLGPTPGKGYGFPASAMSTPLCDNRVLPSGVEPRYITSSLLSTCTAHAGSTHVQQGAPGMPPALQLHLHTYSIVFTHTPNHKTTMAA